MKIYNWDLIQIKEAVSKSINFTEVLEIIGIPRQGNNTTTLKNFLDKNNIDYSHFTGRARIYNSKRTPIEDYLENKIKIKSGSLKNKLINAGLKENKCEKCGLSEWLGKPITCQLHHIDGNSLNNSLENLIILCPNCHSQTENFCGNANKKEYIKYYCPDCGKEISKRSKYCSVCAFTHKRKIDRPTKETLLYDFNKLGSLLKVGNKYGVSDNTIRKWLKSYNLPTSVKELKKYSSIDENKI